MVRGPKGFTEAEKEALRKQLYVACENRWALQGYKKTSIGELTASVGISTGAFYLLFGSKEELFCETLVKVQEELSSNIRRIILKNVGIQGFQQSLIWQFEEYDKRPFLYDVSSVDFLAFLNKLPQEKIAALKIDSQAFFYEMVDKSQLQLIVSQDKAFAVVNSLLYTVTNKERFAYDHRDVFAVLLDGVIPKLFKEGGTKNVV